MSETKVTSKEVASQVVVSQDGDQLIQRGWGYYTGDGVTTTPTVTITLPIAFDDTAYDISAIMLGYKAGSDPTSRTDVGLAATEYISSAVPISASQFKVGLHRSSDAAFASGTRIAFSWTAIGTKAR